MVKNNEKKSIKDFILTFVRSRDYSPLTKEELISKMNMDNSDEDLSIIIDEMVKEVDLWKTDKDKLIDPAIPGLFKGEVVGANNEYAYVRLNGAKEGLEDYKVAKPDDVVVMPGSQVAFKLYARNDRNGRLFRIVKDVKHEFVCEVIGGNSNRKGELTYYLRPFNKRIGYKLTLPKEENNLVVDGDYVKVSLNGVKNKGIVTHIEKNICHKDDINADIKALVEEEDVRTEFPQEVLDQAKSLPTYVTEEEKKGRIDRTDDITYTVDPNGAMDKDDAVSFKKLRPDLSDEESPIRVRVYIADVSHYVKEGSPIDEEAKLRGTSIYLANKVIPMLPRSLSNGICSLHEGKERLAVCYEYVVNPDGSITDFDFSKTVIKVKKSLNYDQVQEMIDGKEGVEEKYGKQTVADFKLAEQVRKRREACNKFKIDVPSTEIRFKYDENDYPIEAYPVIQRESEKETEVEMVGANIVTARYAHILDALLMYRDHEAPKLEKLEKDFIPTCLSLGIKPRFNEDNVAYEYKRIMSLVKDDALRTSLSETFVRCLEKAYYGVDELGHYGLGEPEYSQTTAPIRRYPDLVNQRIMKLLYHLDKNPEYLQENQDLREEYEEIARMSSEAEVKAMKLEMKMVDRDSAKFMKNKIGNQYIAIVSGFQKKGLFVRLDNRIEVFIPFATLKKDSFKYDPTRRIAIGTRSGETFKLGDPLKVEITRADIDMAQIDAEIIKRLVRKDNDIVDVEGIEKSKKDNVGKNNKNKKNRNRGRR